MNDLPINPDHTDDGQDPATAHKVRRALTARADQTVASPDALDSIRRRRSGPGWVRPATYAAVAATIVLIAGVAFLNRPSDDTTGIDSRDSSTTLPPDPTVTQPDPYPTTEPPDATPTTIPPADDPGDGSTPADLARVGLVLWPTDGAGAASAEAAVRGWVENVLGVSAEHLTEQMTAENPGDGARFALPLLGEDGRPLDDRAVDIWAGSPDGTTWFVTEAGGSNLRIDLVERNGYGPGLRVTGFGHAFEGTGLLWIDDADPEIVSIGADADGDEFSVIVPWDGNGPVRVRLETGTAFEGQVPEVRSFATEPEPASTDIEVVGVELGDVLNVRRGAGIGEEIVFTLDPFARAITHTGGVERVGGEEWWEIVTPEGLTGWANSRYLYVWPDLAPDSPRADEMKRQAELFLRSFAPSEVPGGARPEPHPRPTEIGGIGVFADAPTPFTAVEELWSESLEFDWDPFPEEADHDCGGRCILTVREFLDVRPKDVTEAEYQLGFSAEDSRSGVQYLTGLTEDFFNRYATVVAYVPAESTEVLDWRRYTFTFDFIDGSPTISRVWRWGWTP